MIDTNSQKIEEILTRGVEEIFEKENAFGKDHEDLDKIRIKMSQEVQNAKK
jgi:hypothetical protein